LKQGYDDAVQSSPIPDPLVPLVRELLEGFELFSLGARLRAYNSDVIDAAAGSYVMHAYDVHKKYIEQVRRAAGQTVYEHFQWLAEQLIIRRQKALELPGSLEASEQFE